MHQQCRKNIVHEIIINKQCRRELYETISIGFFARVFIPACHEVVVYVDFV